MPDGGLAAGGAGWTLGPGARGVAQPSAPLVPGATDHQVLQLAPGASATTPAVCVGLLHPTVRLLARGEAPLLSGLLSGRLRVEVLYEDVQGNVHGAPVLGVALSGLGWAPTLPMPFLVNLGTLVRPDGSTAVAFRLTAERAQWWVDDVSVDPFKAR